MPGEQVWGSLGEIEGYDREGRNVLLSPPGQSDHGLYLFAVNYDERARESLATIRVEGLAAGTAVSVVDEARTLQARDGAFTDTFAPLAVHIYRLAAATTAR